MKLSLRPTTVDDMDGVREFLRQAFSGSETELFLDPTLMRWKYWDRRADWEEPRAYVLEQDGVMVAHAGLWPMAFAGGGVRGVQLIDWASSKLVPGSGRALLQRISGRFDFMYAVGGNKRTRSILPAQGFEEYGKVWNYARPLRPVRQIRSHPSRGWKLAPRLARNMLWSAAKAPGGNGGETGWQAEEIRPDQISKEFYQLRMEEGRFSPRPPAFFDYLFACPALPIRLYGIRDEQGWRGHLAVGLMRGQALVGGVWLRDPDEEAWRAAYTLAQQVAKRLDGANEVAVSGTAGVSERGAAKSGLRNVEYTPVYLLNNAGRLKLRKDFQFQLCDHDAFFLDLGHSAYWT